MPCHNGVTQCYLPPGRGDIPALTPAEAGTRLSDPRGMQGWVDLIGYWPTITHFYGCHSIFLQAKINERCITLNLTHLIKVRMIQNASPTGRNIWPIEQSHHSWRPWADFKDIFKAIFYLKSNLFGVTITLSNSKPRFSSSHRRYLQTLITAA